MSEKPRGENPQEENLQVEVEYSRYQKPVAELEVKVQQADAELSALSDELAASEALFDKMRSLHEMEQEADGKSAESIRQVVEETEKSLDLMRTAIAVKRHAREIMGLRREALRLAEDRSTRETLRELEKSGGKTPN